MSSVLLGSTGLNPLRTDSETNPPHGKPGQSSWRKSRERRAVVGSNRLRQTEFSKYRFKYLPCRLEQWATKSPTSNEITTATVAHRQGVATLLCNRKMSLEVSTPHRIGAVVVAQTITVRRAPAYPPPFLDEPILSQNLSHRARRRHCELRIVPLQEDNKLSRSPTRVFLPDSQDLLHHVARDGVRM